MKKGIIVVDVPEGCTNCSFAVSDNKNLYCELKGKDNEDYVLRATKPDWCPIRELPQKMEVCGKYPQPGKPMPSYRIGWNDCLKAITLGNQDFIIIPKVSMQDTDESERSKHVLLEDLRKENGADKMQSTISGWKEKMTDIFLKDSKN